jgi:hypothetical protein
MAWMIMMAGTWAATGAAAAARTPRLAFADESVNELLPPYPGESRSPWPTTGAVSRTAGADETARQAGQVPRPVWKRRPTVGGASSRTSGKPLLANDPHLSSALGPVVFRAARSAWLRWQATMRACRRGAGPERADRLGLHQHQPRRADLYLEQLSRTTGANTARPKDGQRSRRTRR